jgi:ribosomal protein S18 acetylase RimI-like enzyme
MSTTLGIGFVVFVALAKGERSSLQDMRIVPAQRPEEIAAARELFLEYAASLGLSLCFQGFARELAELPCAYAPPRGCLLLAMADRPAGCVGVRPLHDDVCEMKRLYVRPESRGLGVGRALVEAACAAGRVFGYRAMRLDTLPSMTAAIAIYGARGFRPIEPYCDNPIPGAIFFEMDLG